MQTLRSLPVIAAAAVLVFPLVLSTAQAQTKITVGKSVGGSGFHIPSYIAMDRGLFKAEGLDARLVPLDGKALVTAGISGSVDFIPIPSGGAQAALSGAQIRYIVGESLKSQWVIVSSNDITKPEDLRGKTVGYGRVGSADYDEGASVLKQFFKLDVGKDYKVIMFPGEPERIAALINGDIKAALISIPAVPKVAAAGMKVLLKTGDYMPRAGGTIWTTKAYADAHPETVKKFIRAIGKAVMYFRDNKEGSIATLREHLSVDNDRDGAVVWEQLRNTMGAEVPADLFRDILEQRRLAMIGAKQWPADKPLPDPEQFLARNLLESTLKEMNYVPTKLDAPVN